MDTVLEPSLLCITDEEWQQEEIRDNFLYHLLHNLKRINEFNLAKIKWSDEFEAVLYSPPHLPPWRRDRDFKNIWVPTIMKLLYNRLVRINNTLLEPEPCNVTPEITSSYGKIELYLIFMRLMHYFLTINEDVYLCVGSDNKSNAEYSFFCSCHPERMSPRLINNPDDWLQHVNVAKELWPLTEEESSKLHKALEITIKVVFGKTCKDLCYKYSFDRGFLNDLLSKNCLRTDLFYGLTKRLLCTQQEASSDAGLKDEPVRSTIDIRRFRITGLHRIHYKYLNDGSIIFLNYYGDGEHEKGL